MTEVENTIIEILQSIADSQKGQLESQLRIEKDTRETNDRLLKVAESNAMLLHRDRQGGHPDFDLAGID